MCKNRLFPQVLFVTAVCLAIPACQRSETETLKREPPVVTVALPLTQEVIDFAEYTARTKPLQSVDIYARVSGYLDSINFTPGTEVKEGDLLFVIDPRPYQAALDKAKAEEEACTARLERANSDMNRAQQLIGNNAISKEDYDRFKATQLDAVAQLEGAKAAWMQADLNLKYAHLKAPITGRISRNYIDKGNLVTAEPNPTKLTNIVTVDPIYAYFDIDEMTLLRLLKEDRESMKKADLKKKISEIVVEFELANEQGYPHAGHLDFIENQVDPTTGTLNIRAIFPNPQLAGGARVIMPGLFGRVRIPTSDKYSALLVPDLALQNDQAQKFLYVVNDKNEAVRKPVKLGALKDDSRVIIEGIAPSDRVIVNGIQFVRPGMTVNPKVVEKLHAPKVVEEEAGK